MNVMNAMNSKNVFSNSGKFKNHNKIVKFQVSIPQYVRLVNLQNFAIQMDRYMKKLAAKLSPNDLMNDPNWMQLVLIHKSLGNLLPEEVKQ